MRQTTILAAVLASLALGACGDSDGDENGTPEQARTTTAATTGGCERVSRPAPRDPQELPRPDLRLNRRKTYTAQLITTCGQIDIRLDVRESPKTAASFVALARDGFFDSLTFHRIAAGPDGSDFVIQGGDPLGSGQGGPGYSVVEAPPSDARYTRGVVAMAKTAAERPGTSGSQFFIVTAEDAGLPAEYAVLGRVVKGMDAVQRIAAVPTDPQTEQPRAPVVIRQVKIVVG